MLDSLLVFEETNKSHINNCNWRSIDSYAYVRNISNILNYRVTCDSQDEYNIGYNRYIVDIYIPMRRQLMEQGWKRGEKYPVDISRYFIWRDCLMAIAWEYLRRSNDYKCYYERLERVVRDVVPNIKNCLRRSMNTRIDDISRQWIDDSETSSTEHPVISWDTACCSIDFNTLLYAIPECDKADLERYLFIIKDSYERMYKMFRVYPGMGMPHPTSIVPPIFMDFTKPIDVIGTKPMFGNVTMCVGFDEISPYAAKVFLSFDLNEDIEGQLDYARSHLEYFRSKFIGTPVALKDKSKSLRHDKHVEYMRILDAIADGVTSPSQMSQFICSSPGEEGAVKRLEKAIIAAEALSRKTYFLIATQPYFKFEQGARKSLFTDSLSPNKTS